LEVLILKNKNDIRYKTISTKGIANLASCKSLITFAMNAVTDDLFSSVMTLPTLRDFYFDKRNVSDAMLIRSKKEKPGLRLVGQDAERLWFELVHNEKWLLIDQAHLAKAAKVLASQP
jgi:hypothetical protein